MTGPAVDARRTLRTMLSVAVLLVFGLFALFPSVILGAHLATTSDAVTDRNQQLLVYQALADIPFAAAAVLAVASLRSGPDGRSWRLLGWAGGSAVVGFALLFVNAMTAPPL
jgi:hypothetical protein